MSENGKIELTYGQVMDLSWVTSGGTPEQPCKFIDRENLDFMRVIVPLVQFEQRLNPHVQAFYTALKKAREKARSEDEFNAKRFELLGEKVEVEAPKLDKAHLVKSGITPRETKALRPLLDL